MHASIGIDLCDCFMLLICALDARLTFFFCEILSRLSCASFAFADVEL